MEMIEYIRDFNRAYTTTLGVLNNTYLDSERTLTEIRVLYEIWNSKGCSANQIRKNLRLNEGYISRVIKKLEKIGLLKKIKSEKDSRTYQLYLTDNGKEQVNDLSEKTRAQISYLLQTVSEDNQKRLVQAMSKIREILKI